MDRDVARIPFDLLRGIQDYFRIFIRFVKRTQVFFYFEGMVYRHGKTLRAEGDRFRDPIAHGVWVAHRARDVPDSRPRHHGAEGSYLRDFVFAVFFARVFDKVISSVVRDVHVDVRGFRPLGI